VMKGELSINRLSAEQRQEFLEFIRQPVQDEEPVGPAN
jgi:hypothetical protein